MPKLMLDSHGREVIPATILVVEDEPAIRELLKFNLVQAGHRLHAASSAEQALGIIENGNDLPDLILLDWLLPGMSGVRFARHLKSSLYTCKVPIIMLTARGEEDDKTTALEAGADDFITKPFSPRELSFRIGEIMRKGTR